MVSTQALSPSFRIGYLAVALCLAALCSFSTTVFAQEFVEGEHYQVLPISVETSDPSKVEVVEVFSYACVHCYNFDPYVEAWQRQVSGDVAFRRVPATFNSDWELLAQAYYTAEALGVNEAVHMPLFEGIHEKRQDLRKTDLLADLFETEAGVNPDDFSTAHGSFSVRSRVQQAKAKTRAYRITGVPSMVVNGKYLVDGKLAGGNVKMLEVVDFLIAKEAQAGAGADAGASE